MICEFNKEPNELYYVLSGKNKKKVRRGLLRRKLIRAANDYTCEIKELINNIIL
jgi:hypothetical protein